MQRSSATPSVAYHGVDGFSDVAVTYEARSDDELGGEIPNSSEAPKDIIDFPGGSLQIHQSAFTEGLESLHVLAGDRYLLDMSLSRRPAAATAASTRLPTEEALGRVFLIPPGETIRIFTPQGQCRSIRCTLDASLIDPFLPVGRIWDSETLSDALQLGGGQIEWLMWRMYRELQKAEIGSIQIIEGLAKQLSVEVIRRFAPGQQGASRHVGGLAPWRLRLIEKKANEPGHLPKLEELASVCDVSVRHLSRAFRMETGQTLGKYLESVMAHRAHGMLTEGVPVSRVAQSLGYARAANFALAFRRATGLLPTEVKTAAERQEPGAPGTARKLAVVEPGAPQSF